MEGPSGSNAAADGLVSWLSVLSELAIESKNWSKCPSTSVEKSHDGISSGKSDSCCRLSRLYVGVAAESILILVMGGAHRLN